MQIQEKCEVSSWNQNIKTVIRKDVPANGKAVFIIRGGNRPDELMFVRGSQEAIRFFLSKGYQIYILDIDVSTDYRKSDEPCELPKRNLGEIIKDALLNIPSLHRIQMYVHARYDINFTTEGAELSATRINERKSEPYNLHRVYIGDLKIGKPASGLGWVDMYACMMRPVVAWPQLLADTLGWPVRTVAPGYSVYFPEDIGFPRAQMAMNLTSSSKYETAGWTLYMPGWDHFIRLQPDRDEFLGIDQFVSERKLQMRITKILDPFRVFRKYIMKVLAKRRKAKYGAPKNTGI